MVNLLAREAVPHRHCLGHADAYCVLEWSHDGVRAATFHVGSLPPTQQDSLSLAGDVGIDLTLSRLRFDTCLPYAAFHAGVAGNVISCLKVLGLVPELTPKDQQ